VVGTAAKPMVCDNPIVVWVAVAATLVVTTWQCKENGLVLLFRMLNVSHSLCFSGPWNVALSLSISLPFS